MRNVSRGLPRALRSAVARQIRAQRIGARVRTTLGVGSARVVARAFRGRKPITTRRPTPQAWHAASER